MDEVHQPEGHVLRCALGYKKMQQFLPYCHIFLMPLGSSHNNSSLILRYTSIPSFLPNILSAFTYSFLLQSFSFSSSHNCSFIVPYFVSLNISSVFSRNLSSFLYLSTSSSIEVFLSSSLAVLVLTLFSFAEGIHPPMVEFNTTASLLAALSLSIPVLPRNECHCIGNILSMYTQRASRMHALSGGWTPSSKV